MVMVVWAPVCFRRRAHFSVAKTNWRRGGFVLLHSTRHTHARVYGLDSGTFVADEIFDRPSSDEIVLSPHICPPFSVPCCAGAVPQSNVQFVVEGFITGVLTLMCGMSGILLVHVSLLLLPGSCPLFFVFHPAAGLSMPCPCLVVAAWIMMRC